MKVFNATSYVDLNACLNNLHEMDLSSIKIPFNDIVKETKMFQPEAVVIIFHGSYYILPCPIVMNAWKRKEALAKLDKHYVAASDLQPEMISLNQCLHIEDDYTVRLIEESLDHH